MKITGFKLLKNGTAGIEVEGIDLVESGVGRSMFRDNVKRTRSFPLSPQLRNAVNALRYPFLVGIEQWQGGFGMLMREDYSRPDRRDEFVGSPDYKRLTNLWDSAMMQKCVVDNGNYKISGELNCEMAVVKATVTIAPDNDHSLYSFVQEALGTIVELIDQTLSLPQVAIGGGAAIRELLGEMHGEEIGDELSDDDAFIAMMRTAQKKGYGIILNEDSLAQLASGLDQEAEEIDLDIPQVPVEVAKTKKGEKQSVIIEIPTEEELPAEDQQPLGSLANLVSQTTADGSIFRQEPTEEFPTVNNLSTEDEEEPLL